MVKVFVTGASGYLGLAVVEELCHAGHEVVGLVRSDAAAERVLAVGGSPSLGDLQDLELLRAAVEQVDAVAHLAWVAPSAGVDPVEVDRAAIAAFGDALAGSGRRLVVASGVLGLDPGRLVTESARPSASTSIVLAGRAANAETALDLVGRGVETVVVRLAPSVHDEGRIKPGFAGRLVEIARRSGSAGYPGDGSMRWSAVHRRDAAELFRLALEQASGGTVLHGVAEEGVSQRAIAETIAAGLHVPSDSLSHDQARERFGWLAPLVELDAPASSATTQSSMGWTPTGPGLLQDLRGGAYFEAAQR